MLSVSITQAQIDAAEQMLTDFYCLMPELYGESSCTHNCHLLSHLAKYVRLWGPLWTPRQAMANLIIHQEEKEI